MSKLDVVVVPFRQNIRGTNNLELVLDVFWRKCCKKRVYLMSGQKLIHQKKKNNLSILCKNQCTSFSLAGGLSSSVCASLRKKKNHSNIAGLALQPDSSSMLEIYVGFRARGLRWCIAVRTVLLYMLSRKAK